jgi:hypothetical protein
MDLKNTSKESEELAFFVVAEKMLDCLAERSRNIVKRRFGLGGDFSIQTLEKIGFEYGVTRERVRQIISDAKKNIEKKQGENAFQKAEDKLLLAIEKRGGIIKEETILQELNLRGLRKEENAMRFLADRSKKIQFVLEKNRIEKSWTNSLTILKRVILVADEAGAILEKNQKLFSDDEFSQALLSRLPEFSKRDLLYYLDVLAQIKKNRFGKWGKKEWPEVSPKGSREKIYLVLKEEKKPLHFTQIAKLIDKYKLSKKPVHPQTIHNELIKDSRFVLIGRGIYALGEWGYSGGAVKDVLKTILEKSAEPLDREEIIKKVFEVRKVKRTTIMINLNSGNFEKEGMRYSLKK